MNFFEYPKHMTYKQIYESYPNAQLQGINAIYVEGVGWYDLLIGAMDSNDDDRIEAEKLIRKGTDILDRKITHFNLNLLDKFDIIRFADFAHSELVF